jgi:tripartite-type tricarboxylate transporter receptor subunit TctC
VAARILAATAPDGRTLGVVTTPALLARLVERDEASLLDGLDLAAAVAEDPVLLVAPPGVGPGLEPLRALAEQGGLLGTPPPGTASHLAAVALQEVLPLSPLAFPSPAAARQAVLAGNLAAALLPMSDAIAALREGRITGLAIAAEQRSPLLPDVPSFAEHDLALRIASHRGIALPQGVAERVRESLANALRAAVADPEFAEQAAAIGYTPRFLAHHEWAPTMRRLAAELQRRWEAEPWIPRRG